METELFALLVLLYSAVGLLALLIQPEKQIRVISLG